MKKLMSLILLSAALCGFAASEEDAVKQVYRDYHTAFVDLKVSRAMEFLTDDFYEISAEGKRIGAAEAKRIAAAFDDMSAVCAKKDPSLREIITVVTRISGTEMTREQLDQIKALENDPDAKKQAVLLQSGLNVQLNEMKTRCSSAWATQKIRNCAVNGDNALLIFEMNSINDPSKVEITEWNLVKSDGRWRIKKAVSKYRK